MGQHQAKNEILLHQYKHNPDVLRPKEVTFAGSHVFLLPSGAYVWLCCIASCQQCQQLACLGWLKTPLCLVL